MDFHTIICGKTHDKKEKGLIVKEFLGHYPVSSGLKASEKVANVLLEKTTQHAENLNSGAKRFTLDCFTVFQLQRFS